VEEYVLAELEATAERAGRGLGPLMRMLAELAADVAGPATLEAMEQVVVVRGRELLRAVLQHGLDAGAAAEVRLAQVTGPDGVARRMAERGHGRAVVTTLGTVRVERIAYRAGVKGVPALFARDAMLNLPARSYSWPLQQLAVMFTRSVSYEQAREFVRAATGVTAGKRQLEQITAEAAAGADRYYPALAAEKNQQQQHGLQEEGQPARVLVLSADGKGVVVRPEARRPRRGKKGQRVKKLDKRLGSGEKAGTRRMAETGVVFEAIAPPGPPRTPEQVMTRPAGEPARGPRAADRWYTADITVSRKQTIAALFAEADRRDPGRGMTWVALADGDVHQIQAFQDLAAARGVTLTILIDFIHVLEYLWKAAWCFHPPAAGPAAEAWVTAQALDILGGNAAAVTARIRGLAAARPPKAGSEHDKNIRKTLTCLDAKAPCLDYPAALANGWPIATAVIEGACRHLVQDRMGITGARWSLPGADAILWLRAIHANAGTSAYWTWHIQQQHHHNHLSRFSSHSRHDLGLAA
jgi:hypothetical protein